LDEAEGRGGEQPPQKLRLPPHQQSRFCRTMAQAKTGQDAFILFPVFGGGAGRKKSSRPLTDWIGGA